MPGFRAGCGCYPRVLERRPPSLRRQQRRAGWENAAAGRRDGLRVGAREAAANDHERRGRPSVVAFDSIRNRIVVASREPRIPYRAGAVAVFSPGSSKPLRRLRDADNPAALIFDSVGRIYVANEGSGRGDGGSVTVYRPGGTTPIRTISGDYYGMWAPSGLALDPQGNLYVANGPTAVGSVESVYIVSVYAPGSSTPTTIIEDGIDYPRAIAISAGYLYVANAPPKRSKYLPNGSVTVYALRSGVLSGTITRGIDAPYGLAFDGSGNLYVANLRGQDVTVYAPGGTSPIRTISHGVSSPKALAIGPQGNLYIANLYQSTISVYKDQQTTPFLAITQGLEAPTSIALSCL